MTLAIYFRTSDARLQCSLLLDNPAIFKPGGALTQPRANAILSDCRSEQFCCFEGRRDGRVDDGNGLENRSGLLLTGGSNPSPSALTNE